MAQSDPFSLLTQSMRKMASLRIDDVTRGLENFANPSARGMLESMGRTRDEQVETMASMLRNSSEAEIEEMGTVFGMAMAKLAEERSNSEGHAERHPERHPRLHRRQTAAERRRERRLAS
jgi:predicted O-methyltransferase YrrM